LETLAGLEYNKNVTNSDVLSEALSMLLKIVHEDPSPLLRYYRNGYYMMGDNGGEREEGNFIGAPPK
jgi:hypothetical protein